MRSTDREPSFLVLSGDQGLAQLMDRLTEQVLAGACLKREEIAAEYPKFARELEQLWPALTAMFDLAAARSDDAEEFENRVVTGRSRLGDFEIVREVGRGGMGVVYEAEQISLGRRVALKILPFAAVLDERQLARFKNEAMAAALLEHPHIVPVYAVGCERGIHFYAMRFIEGQTLAEAFAVRRGEHGSSPPPEGERGRPSASNLEAASPGEGLGEGPQLFPHATLSPTPSLPHTSPAAETRRVTDLSTQLTPASPAWWRRLADLGIQAAEALEHAHQHGIVHRDVKPGNLLIDARGQLWVTDFGLAQVSGSAELTMTGDLLGTLRYMSPEQARGERILDQRTDVYSLGATLYEMIVGRPAFPATDRQRLLRQIVEEEPTPPRQLNKRVPVDLETIVLKAMAKEPAERYQTAAALAEDLRRFSGERPITAKATTTLMHLQKLVRRHRNVMALVATAAFFTSFVAALLLWRERQRTGHALHQAQEALAFHRLVAESYYTRSYPALGESQLEELLPRLRAAVARFPETLTFRMILQSQLLRNALRADSNKALAFYREAIDNGKHLLAAGPRTRLYLNWQRDAFWGAIPLLLERDDANGARAAHSALVGVMRLLIEEERPSGALYRQYSGLLSMSPFSDVNSSLAHEALSAAERAVRAAPEEAASYHVLAWAHYRAGELRQAKAAFDQMISCADHDSPGFLRYEGITSRLGRSMVAAQSGDHELAVSLLQEARTMAPGAKHLEPIGLELLLSEASAMCADKETADPD